MQYFREFHILNEEMYVNRVRSFSLFDEIIFGNGVYVRVLETNTHWPTIGDRDSPVSREKRPPDTFV